MRPRILAIATTLVLAITGSSVAATTHSLPPKQVKQYLKLYKKVQQKEGKRAPGRNIVRYGLSNGKRVTVKHLAASMVVLRNIISPPPPPVVAPVVAHTAYAPTQVQSYGGGGGCSGMSAESGSLGYNNNTHAGYVGCYQISQDHFGSSGSCHGLGTDPAGQDQCAAIICRTEGAGAWTNPAGQNPCGRLRR